MAATMDERPMRREIATGIEIDAPPASVWAVLSDFSSYPEWNTFLRWVEGRIAEGERIRFCFELPRGFRFKVTATILKVTPRASPALGGCSSYSAPVPRRALLRADF
jgi:uncharacterized protein YndB with AHSA1/START domain